MYSNFKKKENGVEVMKKPKQLCPLHHFMAQLTKWCLHVMKPRARNLPVPIVMQSFLKITGSLSLTFAVSGAV